jgi:DNA modification methylase
VKPFLSDPDLTLYRGDVREVLAGLPAESVHCVVTSPPYWGLRDYGATGQLGLEATPDLYVERMVAVFREVRRVLRLDGSCWLNIGDSYHGGGGGNYGTGLSSKQGGQHLTNVRNRLELPDIKPKDLCMIPARLALALQADGWWLRSQIVWSKPNPMPESVTDRPTTSHEFVYLLTKSPRYFFDQEAVREPHAPPFANRTEKNRFRLSDTGDPNPVTSRQSTQRAGVDYTKNTGLDPNSAGRNVRSVWEIATQPYPEAHFATYPEELVRRCILAGSSERGCCPECGAPWTRKVKYERGDMEAVDRPKHTQSDKSGLSLSGNGSKEWAERGGTAQTLGWYAVCVCGDEQGVDSPPIPCTVLDPFFGSGTTGLVARKHGRRTIGIELNADYCELASRRVLKRQTSPLPRDFEPASDGTLNLLGEGVWESS